MADTLNSRLKTLIIETLHLEDVTPESITDDEPLIGGGLSLDSIDALELVVTLEKEFGVKISSRGVLKLNGAVDRDKIPDIRGRFCFIKGA